MYLLNGFTWTEDSNKQGRRLILVRIRYYKLSIGKTYLQNGPSKVLCVRLIDCPAVWTRYQDEHKDKAVWARRQRTLLHQSYRIQTRCCSHAWMPFFAAIALLLYIRSQTFRSQGLGFRFQFLSLCPGFSFLPSLSSLFFGKSKVIERGIS